MPGLLDYTIKGYQTGGGVDIDPYADTNQQDTLDKLGISITNPSAKSLLPTYDTLGADMVRQSYSLRSDALRRGATGSLFDLTTQSSLQGAASGFQLPGARERAYSDVREDVVSGYGAKSQEQYLDFQKDIYGLQKDYERDLLSAVGDLDPDDYKLGDPSTLASNTEQREIREALNRGETITRGQGEQWQPPSGMGYDGEQRYGSDGIVYTWNSASGQWIPNQAGGTNLATMGAYGTYG